MIYCYCLDGMVARQNHGTLIVKKHERRNRISSSHGIQPGAAAKLNQRLSRLKSRLYIIAGDGIAVMTGCDWQGTRGNFIYHWCGIQSNRGRKLYKSGMDPVGGRIRFTNDVVRDMYQRRDEVFYSFYLWHCRKRNLDTLHTQLKI